MMPGRKREWLARGLLWSGLASLTRLAGVRDQLLVLNYHRIGDAGEDLFDPGVFSATGDELNEQIAYLKRKFSLVTLDEAFAFVEGRPDGHTPRCRVLITYDDGYLDNYQLAFPILKSHGVQGVFFLATSMVGSAFVPWWDHVAYLLKTARKRRFAISYPADMAVDLDAAGGVNRSIREVLKMYKRPENTDQARFLRELQERAQGDDLPGTLRRFLNWEEAREMIRGGMMIGSHTHSHGILSQLGPEEQRRELSESRALLRSGLGIEVDTLAYPVGKRTSFSDQTEELARDAGYRGAFSFHGGTNLPGKIRPYDVKRLGVGGQSRSLFRVQTTVCRATANYWP